MRRLRLLTRWLGLSTRKHRQKPRKLARNKLWRKLKRLWRKAQYEKQRYANLLQELAGQLEINLLRQKADMLAAQKAYQEAIQNNDDATRTRLSEPFPRLSRRLRKQFYGK